MASLKCMHWKLNENMSTSLLVYFFVWKNEKIFHLGKGLSITLTQDCGPSATILMDHVFSKYANFLKN